MSEKVGYIYIFRNPYMPDLIKIGYTNSIKTRLNKFNSETSSPRGWNVYATLEVPFYAADKKIHNIICALAPSLRIDDKREFFKMDPEVACDLLSNIGAFIGKEIEKGEYNEREEEIVMVAQNGRKSIRDDELSFLKELKSKCFKEESFYSNFAEREPNIRANYLDFVRKSSGENDHVVVRATSREIHVEWYMADNDKAKITRFYEQKEKLQKLLEAEDGELEWNESNGNSNSKIVKDFLVDYSNITDNDYQQIMSEIQLFDRVFHSFE